jgi:uncharacterized integral membrane protein
MAEQGTGTTRGAGTAGGGGAGSLHRGTGRVRLNSKVVGGLIGCALLVVFMAQNTENVTVHFLFWNLTWPLWLFTLVMAVLGALVWMGFGVLRRHRRRRARREAR